MAGTCSAPTLRLDRTKPFICSAAELVLSRALLERNFEQSSPSRLRRTASVRQVRGPEPPRKSRRQARLSRVWGDERELVLPK